MFDISKYSCWYFYLQVLGLIYPGTCNLCCLVSLSPTLFDLLVVFVFFKFSSILLSPFSLGNSIGNSFCLVSLI